MSKAAEQAFPDGSGGVATQALRQAFDHGARQALLDYADLLDGPTYTMNYGSAEGYADQVIGLLRRDAELLYGN